jgi:hypothetical protein
VQVQHVEQDVSDILSRGKEHVLNNKLKQDVPDICVEHLAPEQLAEDSNTSKHAYLSDLLLSVNLRMSANKRLDNKVCYQTYVLDMIGNHN